ncbi:MAG: hypothetical protein A4S17_12825 [Proteobacteria bacterium HN_bin10]|nr:MAG: hypothetical protein A4S17_12825 [Proteobacteria bacterium HN_bin10]
MNKSVIGWSLAVCLLLGSAVARAATEDEAVRQVILQTVRAVAEFPASRDRHAVLRLYAKDYSGFQDGEAETLDAVRAWLEEYEGLLAQGSSVRYAGDITDLTVRLSETTAWATYQYVFQVLSAGQVQGEDKGLCTNILKKEAGAWLILHEHCSQARRSRATR